MAHVQIRQGDSPTTLQVIVDGVDLSMHVYDDSFALVKVGEDDFAVWGVQMVLAPDVLDIDLPESVIHATIEDREVGA